MNVQLALIARIRTNALSKRTLGETASMAGIDEIAAAQHRWERRGPAHSGRAAGGRDPHRSNLGSQHSTTRWRCVSGVPGGPLRLRRRSRPTLPESSCRIHFGELEGAFKLGEHRRSRDVKRQLVGAARCQDLMPPAGSRARRPSGGGWSSAAFRCTGLLEGLRGLRVASLAGLDPIAPSHPPGQLGETLNTRFAWQCDQRVAPSCGHAVDILLRVPF